MPVDAAKFRLLGDVVVTELLWIPVFKPVMQPEGDNPWAVETTLPANVHVTMADAIEPETSLENSSHIMGHDARLADEAHESSATLDVSKDFLRQTLTLSNMIHFINHSQREFIRTRSYAESTRRVFVSVGESVRQHGNSRGGRHPGGIAGRLFHHTGAVEMGQTLRA